MFTASSHTVWITESLLCVGAAMPEHECRGDDWAGLAVSQPQEFGCTR